MKRLTSLPRELLAAIGVFISRLGLLPANVSPLGSYGFFGKNAGLYIVSIIFFDALRGGFYKGFLFTYAGFLMYPLLGRLTKKQSLGQLVALPLASFSFFLLSNLGVWLYWYPHSLSGLLACYLAALPFYSRTLLGDCIFGYGYLIAKRLSSNISKRHLLFSPWKIIKLPLASLSETEPSFG